MSGYDSPNYTQAPNELFDGLLPDLSQAELKVTLAIVRQTFGWHREKHELSIAFLMRATGLSRQGVLDGLERGLARGYLCREPSGQTYRYWLVVNELDGQGSRPEVVKPVDRQVVNESDPKKERGKETKETASLFAYWKEKLEKGPTTRLTPERRRKIQDRLKNYSAADIRKAIDGCAASPWHREHAPTATELTLICRSDTKLEEFMERAPRAKRESGVDWHEKAAREQGL